VIITYILLNTYIYILRKNYDTHFRLNFRGPLFTYDAPPILIFIDIDPLQPTGQNRPQGVDIDHFGNLCTKASEALNVPVDCHEVVAHSEPRYNKNDHVYASHHGRRLTNGGNRGRIKIIRRPIQQQIQMANGILRS
jgi:hypothetical protein